MPRDSSGASLGLLGVGVVAFAIADVAGAWGAAPDLARNVGLVLVVLGATHLVLGLVSGRADARWRWPAMLGVAVFAAGVGAAIWLEGAVLIPFAALGAGLALLHGHEHAQAPAALGIALLAVRAAGPDAAWVAPMGVAGAVGVAAAFLLAAGWRGPRALGRAAS